MRTRDSDRARDGGNNRQYIRNVVGKNHCAHRQYGRRIDWNKVSLGLFLLLLLLKKVTSEMAFAGGGSDIVSKKNIS